MEKDVYQRIIDGEFKPTAPYGETKAEHALYYREVAVLDARFREAVLEELDLSNHPRSGALMSLAWSYGHSSGHTEVLYHAIEMSVLLK